MGTIGISFGFGRGEGAGQATEDGWRICNLKRGKCLLDCSTFIDWMGAVPVLVLGTGARHSGWEN